MELDAGTQSLKQYWTECIDQYERDSEKWRKRADKLVKRYKDERKDDQSAAVRYNILWSNIQTLKPALYAKDPTPEVERRFKDKDTVGRVTSDILERCLSYSVGQHQFGDIMRECVLDKLLVGRGTAWVRYVPHFRDSEIQGLDEVKDEGFEISDDAETDDDNDEQPEQEVEFEEVAYDYVYYEDFGYTKSRTWEEVRAVWRIAYLDRDELKERFGDEIGGAVPLDHKDEKAPEDTMIKKATIYEIWDKSTEKAMWLHKSYPELLDSLEDPLKVDGFFPCPRPMFGTIANDSTIPVPDFVLYQDQANSLDVLSARIAAITKAVKVCGVYDTSAAGIQRVLNDGTENTLIPVDNWAMFAEKGGIQGAMSMLPVGEIVSTLMTLYEVRDKVKQDLYEISGMSDIIRGASDPNETATAQQIKSNYASVRLNDMQRDVQRFSRDLLRIAGQIIANHFQIETIKQICGVKLLHAQEKQVMQQQQAMQPQQDPSAQQQSGAQQLTHDQTELLEEPSWEDVEHLLRDNSARSFRIDIETDSTILQDAKQEQQSRLEFCQTIGQVLQSAAAIVQTAPPLMAPIAESIMFLIRSYKVGRPTESAFQTAIDKMIELADHPMPPPAQPQNDNSVQVEQMKQQGMLQLENQKAQNQMQTDQSSLQTQAQLENQKHSNQMQLLQTKMQHEAEMENMRLSHSNMMDAANQAHAAENQRVTIAAEGARQQMQLAHAAQLAQAQNEAKALQQSANASIPVG